MPSYSSCTYAAFLLTPLREGRHSSNVCICHALGFLLTPLREGRRNRSVPGSTLILDFYSRPCGRGDKDHGRLPPGSAGDFYSRPCGRGDQTASVAKLGYQPISTHAPAGGATTLLCVLAHPATISTHAPAGGATNCAPTKEVQEFVISTHAPAGGATISMTKESAAFAISTHAPAGGATGFLFAFITGGEDFYSRPCGRGDARASAAPSPRRCISTHAPAGGATFSLARFS